MPSAQLLIIPNQDKTDVDVYGTVKHEDDSDSCENCDFQSSCDPFFGKNGDMCTIRHKGLRFTLISKEILYDMLGFKK